MFSFIIDGNGGSYITQLSFQFACYFVGICLLYPVAIWYIPDTNYFKEDTVIVPHHVEEDMGKIQGIGSVDGAATEDVLEEGGSHKTDLASSKGN